MKGRSAPPESRWSAPLAWRGKDRRDSRKRRRSITTKDIKVHEGSRGIPSCDFVSFVVVDFAFGAYGMLSRDPAICQLLELAPLCGTRRTAPSGVQAALGFAYALAREETDAAGAAVVQFDSIVFDDIRGRAPEARGSD